MRHKTSGLALILSMLILSTFASAGERYALVVGNSTYQRAGQLPNAGNDAELIAATLKQLGFTVDKFIDTNEDTFGEALDRLAAKVDTADAVAFYYAGHGLQKDGVNYLVPIDAKLETETAIERETLSLQSFLDVMERAPIGLVFLDACRNNPFAEALLQSNTASGRSAVVGRGLAVVRPRGDLMVTFATLPNSVASDGASRNSPFATSLARNMTVPDVEISVLMKRVTRDVMKATNGEQRPQQLSQMQREFYFTQSDNQAPTEREDIRTVLAVYPGSAKTGEEISVLAEVPPTCEPEFINRSPSRKVTPIPREFFAVSDLGAGRLHYEISPGSRYGLIVQDEDERGQNLIGFLCAPAGFDDKGKKIALLRALDAKLANGELTGTLENDGGAPVAYRFSAYSIR